jgi:hypothetical protein
VLGGTVPPKACNIFEVQSSFSRKSGYVKNKERKGNGETDSNDVLNCDFGDADLMSQH